MNYIPFDGKVRILFVFQVASFWTSWESLYEACKRDERFEVRLAWIDDLKSGDTAQMESAQAFLEDNHIPYEVFVPERVLEFRPHYMVYQTPYDKGHRNNSYWTMRYKRQGIRIVYIPYGIEISDTEESRYKHFTLPPVLNAFRIYVLSEKMREEYGKHCTNATAVRALGLPRFDPLCCRDRFSLSEELRARIGGRKIILWKSHFPKIFKANGQKLQATPDLNEYLKFILYIQIHPELFFIFMPHPKYTDEKVDESLRPLAIRLLEELALCENVYIDRADDYRYSLMNADAIIVDRSAVMIEAAAIHCPVLYMYNRDYDEPMTPPIQGLMESYERGSTALEMAEFCQRVGEGNDLHKEAREEAVRQCLPILDGRIGERIKEDLFLSVQEAQEANVVEAFNPNTRVILFGCGNISRYCDRELRGYQRGKIVAYADNDARRQGKNIQGIPVIAPSEILRMEYDYVVIITERYYFEMHRQLTGELMIPAERIMNYDQYMILCLSLPFLGLEVSRKDAAESMRAAAMVCSMLTDDISRDIYIKRFSYLLSGNYQYIEDMIKKHLPRLTPRKRGGMGTAAEQLPEGQEFVLYGAGDEAEKCMKYFVSQENFVGFCDRNEEKQRKGFHGYPVISPQCLFEEHSGARVLVSTINYAKEISDFLVQNGIPKENITRLAPYMYQQWGNLYFGMQFIDFQEDEVFVDVGATNLDTTLDLLERCACVRKVFAFEPDPQNFRKCMEIKEARGLEQVELYPYGTWEKRGKVLFDAKGNNLSQVSIHGDTEIQTVTVDEIVGEERVTYLKIDVNGAELESLKGARNTILREHPRIAVAVYYRPEDMLVLPTYIASLVPQYKFYLRHHSNTAAKTILYAVI